MQGGLIVLQWLCRNPSSGAVTPTVTYAVYYPIIMMTLNSVFVLWLVAVQLKARISFRVETVFLWKDKVPSSPVPILEISFGVAELECE